MAGSRLVVTSAIIIIAKQRVMQHHGSAVDIRQRIMDAFKRSADLDASTITVVADGDTVKLSGKVHSGYERRIAESAAWAAPGVNRIEDNIMII